MDARWTRFLGSQGLAYRVHNLGFERCKLLGGRKGCILAETRRLGARLDVGFLHAHPATS